MENTELWTEHYQKTYELTYELWKQRNVTFLALLGVIGVATLLTFGAAQTNPVPTENSVRISIRILAAR